MEQQQKALQNDYNQQLTAWKTGDADLLQRANERLLQHVQGSEAAPAAASEESAQTSSEAAVSHAMDTQASAYESGDQAAIEAANQQLFAAHVVLQETNSPRQ